MSSEVQAALLGGMIGALAGLAAGGLAAFAAVRASQLAARAPLGPILCGIADTLIQLRVTAGTIQRDDIEIEFERRWKEFSVHQRILCPSARIESLLSLLLAVARSQKDHPDDVLNLAAQTLEKVTRMVGAHSRHLFRWRATLEESKIMRTWLASTESKVLGEEVRKKLSQLMPSWQIRSLLIGAGFAITAAVIGASVIWYMDRPKPWNTAALTAEYDVMGTEGDDNTLVFYYTLRNNTNKDWSIAEHSETPLFGRLADEERLSGPLLSEWLTTDKPLFVPIGHKIRFAVHLKLRYPDRLKEKASTDERKAFRKKVEEYMASEFSNLDGFVLFDKTNRYEIRLARGWTKSTDKTGELGSDSN